VLLVLLFAAVTLLEAPGLARRRMYRELAAFLGLLAVAMVYSFGLALHWSLPNPAQITEAVFRPVNKILERLLT
jgi:hypothetical protein